MKTKKRTALVTGGSSGIGREFARGLAAMGYDLVLVARDADRLNELGEELSAAHHVDVEVFARDLAKCDAAAELVAEIRRSGITIDALVNNAGCGMQGDFHRFDCASLMELLQLNILALTQLTRLLLPPMVARGEGKILNVASIAAFYPGPLTAAYNASKAFVVSLSEALSMELAHTGVTVTTLCPGPTRSNFSIRAGLSRARAFQSALADPAEVARVGIDAMMKGKRTVVPGIVNRLRMLPIRFIPRCTLAEFSRRYHEVSSPTIDHHDPLPDYVPARSS